MAVPSSGQLRLYADIGVELSVAQSNVSLGSMSNSAGFPEPDAMSDFYGYVDAIAPSVTTNSASSVGQTSFTANGNVTSDGGSGIIQRGFYVGTNSASPTNNSKYTTSGTTGVYSRSITGLSNGTTYYIWAFATNSVGTTYGSRVTQATVAAYAPNWVTKSTGDVAYAGLANYWNIDPYVITYQMWLYYLDPITGGYVLYGSIPKIYGQNPESISVNLDLSDEINNHSGRSNGQYPAGTTNKWRAQGYTNGDFMFAKYMSFASQNMVGLNVSSHTFSPASAGETTGSASSTSISMGSNFNTGYNGTGTLDIDFSFTS